MHFNCVHVTTIQEQASFMLLQAVILKIFFGQSLI
jgi:hypothetical protein